MTGIIGSESGNRFTVTISRQLGSLGSDIARTIAERLSYQFVWREPINQAALRAGAPETALAMIDDFGLLDVHPSSKAYQAYRNAVKQVLEELAVKGRVVILGRAGQAILHDTPQAFHVRIIAPLELRASRVASQEKISLDCAMARIEASDRARRNYLKRCYRVNWNDPELYHLIINTEHITVATAVALICQALIGPDGDRGRSLTQSYGVVH
jgi:cytidylate kinase